MSVGSPIKLTPATWPRVVECMADVLCKDGVVVFPTETVYGIGSLASSNHTSAKRRVYEIKERPLDMPLPLLIADETWLDRIAPYVPEYARRLARTFWPGALTLVVHVSAEVERAYGAAPDGTLALRCPDNDFVRAVLRTLDAPFYATSANTHGAPSPSSAENLEQRIIEAADLVIDGGPCSIGSPSTIVSCIGVKPLVLREGEISQEDIERALL